MKYFSSRNKDEFFNSSYVIANGIAKDGGLYICSEFPVVSEKEIEKMVSLEYYEIAFLILKRFLTDFDEDFLKDCLKKVYSVERFSSDSKIADVVELDDNISVLELWHGKTFAFKDMALQLLPHILVKAVEKEKKGKEVLILTATSGDTGKAALEGFKDVEGTKVFVFYPLDGVSKIQKMSMTTQEGENVFVCGVNGNFDDAQTGIKNILIDEKFKEILDKNNIIVSSANSINWARLVSQIVYYFYAYCRMIENGSIKFGEKINVVVPTGNFGNILACYYAKKMGLFVEDLICASNKNSVVCDFINTGSYDKNREFFKTMSPSMDILVSSNLERLIFDLCGDDKEVIKIYKEFNGAGKFELNEDCFKKLKENFCAYWCDEEETKKTIFEVFNKYSYLIDTHTAVAFNAYKKYINKNRNNFKTLIVSTAFAFKFPQDVLSALGEDGSFSLEDSLEKLEDKTKVKMPIFFKNLSSKFVRFEKSIEKESMKETILKELKIK